MGLLAEGTRLMGIMDPVDAQFLRDGQGRDLFVPSYALLKLGYVLPDPETADRLRRRLRWIDRLIGVGTLTVIAAVLLLGWPWYWSAPVIAIDLAAAAWTSRSGARGLERIPLDRETAERVSRASQEIPARTLWLLLAASLVMLAMSWWLATGLEQRSLGIFGALFAGLCVLVLARRLSLVHRRA
jgi:hypothetical protein